MAYWLMKSEPSTWSWQDQLAKGEAGEPWDGVRNHQAKNYMQEMKKGDLAFFYHSQKDREIVGIVEIIEEAMPDPTAAPDSPWECVTIAARETLDAPVTLAQIKDTPDLAEMVLVKNSRLSVQPVTSDQWALICKMGQAGA
ncbi:hypothetical protein PB2503_03802 [Parvularcula bermudensis HTCC2503]|uniref:EVE domain-containing protein n=1 Tax=Parvularcula bermudensis (strain ATCC BAA-594 / HTCC2503 / KCTC 12087) TaxID=314260 RepID=E0TE14_PARBH|nr:EVE domain-containing protein [Parvularcula bermudensis]ADM08835.1 hypothetical protein PB2503_03802 [Parvularcula bermudensis HTCC2503]